MLTQPMMEKLIDMRLHGMVEALKTQQQDPAAAELRSESVSIDFYDFGQADTSGIAAPPKSQTIDFSKTALAGG